MPRFAIYSTEKQLGWKHTEQDRAENILFMYKCVWGDYLNRKIV